MLIEGGCLRRIVIGNWCTCRGEVHNSLVAACASLVWYVTRVPHDLLLIGFFLPLFMNLKISRTYKFLLMQEVIGKTYKTEC